MLLSSILSLSLCTHLYLLQGCIVYSMNDLPLGFGVAAKATGDCRHADPMNIVTFHQADIGEYIRAEETLL